MKRIAALIMALMVALSNAAAEQNAGGPKGGRLLEGDGLRAEFFVEKDRRASLTFYDEKLEKVPVTAQTATVIGETPAGKKKIEFSERNGELVSKEPLPEAEGYNLVVQIKRDDASRVRNFRIPFETDVCRECGRAEYACICEDH